MNFLRQFSSTSAPKHVLVVGGCGGLGKAVVQQFANSGFVVTNIDFKKQPLASINLKLAQGEEFTSTVERLSEELKNHNFDIIVHTAGGWAGSNAGEPEFPASLEYLLNVNVKSAALAAHLAANSLKSGGMFTLTGAAAALPVNGGTPGMMAYGKHNIYAYCYMFIHS